jgi:hypothetical protein
VNAEQFVKWARRDEDIIRIFQNQGEQGRKEEGRAAGDVGAAENVQPQNPRRLEGAFPNEGDDFLAEVTTPLRKEENPL